MFYVSQVFCCEINDKKPETHQAHTIIAISMYALHNEYLSRAEDNSANIRWVSSNGLHNGITPKIVSATAFHDQSMEKCAYGHVFQLRSTGLVMQQAFGAHDDEGLRECSNTQTQTQPTNKHNRMTMRVNYSTSLW